MEINVVEHVEKLVTTAKKYSQGFSRSEFRKKHALRLSFYELLMDYVSSAGKVNPTSFFFWYLVQLEKNGDKSSIVVSKFRQWTKSKSNGSMRFMLEDCASKLRGNPNLFLGDVLKDWVPEDELMILNIRTDSDISEQLGIVREMAQDKIDAAEMVSNAIKENRVMFFVLGTFHYILYDILYKSLITSPAITEPGYSGALTEIDKSFLVYDWFMNYGNIALIFIIFALIAYGFNYSIKNWCERGVYWREVLFDFIPPYSLSKLTTQYNIIMKLSSYMKSGYGYFNALAQCKNGASKYAIYQIEQIEKRIALQPHQSINTYYMGEFGNLIEARGERADLQDAIETLVPKLKKMRRDKFNAILATTIGVTVKPLMWGSIVMALFPIVMYIIGVFSDIAKSANI